MIIGYARVSTQDQNPALQVDALEKAGAEQVFQEKFTGTLRERPELSQCLRTLREDDVLVVWKLDRLARSLKDLAEFERDLIRERTIAGLQAARARGRKGGRKPAMSDTDTKKAAAMLLDPNITKKEVAEHFGVSRTTLNKSLLRLSNPVKA